MNGLYRGFRTDNGCVVLDRKGRRLNPRTDLVSHGFYEWGYEGDGPRLLAVTLLADALGDMKAVDLHRAFERRVIAQIQGGTWALSDNQIREAVKQIEQDGEVEPRHGEVWDDLPF